MITLGSPWYPRVVSPSHSPSHLQCHLPRKTMRSLVWELGCGRLGEGASLCLPQNRGPTFLFEGLPPSTLSMLSQPHSLMNQVRPFISSVALQFSGFLLQHS